MLKLAALAVLLKLAALAVFSRLAALADLQRAPFSSLLATLAAAVDSELWLAALTAKQRVLLARSARSPVA